MKLTKTYYFVFAFAAIHCTALHCTGMNKALLFLKAGFKMFSVCECDTSFKSVNVMNTCRSLRSRRLLFALHSKEFFPDILLQN